MPSKHLSKKRKWIKKNSKTRKGGSPPACPNTSIVCNFVDTSIQTEYNSFYKTCIHKDDVNYHMIYITPSNTVLKSVETVQIPEFVVKVPTTSMTCKLMIEDKFINAFVNVCNEWYAVMRLFGKTLNRGVFARTEKNKVFYKLKNINFDKTSGMIDIANHGEQVKRLDLFKTSSSPTIKLNEDCYQNITKSLEPYIFPVLHKFRREKFVVNRAQQEVAQDAGKKATDAVVLFQK